MNEHLGDLIEVQALKHNAMEDATDVILETVELIGRSILTKFVLTTHTFNESVDYRDI